jgi:hypothetical protein
MHKKMQCLFPQKKYLWPNSHGKCVKCLRDSLDGNKSTIDADDELGGVNAWIRSSINQKWVAREVKG